MTDKLCARMECQMRGSCAYKCEHAPQIQQKMPNLEELCKVPDMEVFKASVRGNCGVLHSSFKEWQECKACEMPPPSIRPWSPGDQMALDDKIWKALRPLGQPLATQAALERAGLQIVEKS